MIVSIPGVRPRSTDGSSPIALVRSAGKSSFELTNVTSAGIGATEPGANVDATVSKDENARASRGSSD
jgi:hypothetical protein